MRLEEIIIKPILSEKANKLTESFDRYVFQVAQKANKIEIKHAVTKMYNVNVTEVRTSILPRKAKARMTKKGLLVGSKPGYKKAIVSVVKGEKIDFYSDSDL